MAFIPTPDAARIVINWAKGTETYSYTFYATRPGFSYGDQVALAEAIGGIHNATMKARFSTNVAYVNTTVYDARTVDGPIAISAINAGAGTAASEAVSINTAVCVTLRTAGRGRCSRGRKYITGFGEGSLVAGEWNAATGTAATAVVDEIIDIIVASGWVPVIRSIQQDGVHLTTANTRAITTYNVRSLKVATQRRRVDRP